MHTNEKIWLYDQGDYDNYRSKLRATNWQNIINNENLDTSAELISTTILEAASQSIPNKVVTIRPNDIPWFNNKIKRIIRKRNRIHKRAKLLNTELMWSKFRKLRNNVVKLIRKSKSDYKSRIIDQVNNPETPIKVWFKLAKTNQMLNNTIIDNTYPNRKRC